MAHRWLMYGCYMANSPPDFAAYAEALPPFPGSEVVFGTSRGSAGRAGPGRPHLPEFPESPEGWEWGEGPTFPDYLDEIPKAFFTF